jgi:hypothetical protein
MEQGRGGRGRREAGIGGGTAVGILHYRRIHDGRRGER